MDAAKLAPDMSAYNVPVCLRIGPELDAEKARKACAFLLEQFPILTSVIQVENGVPLLVSRPSFLPCFEVETLSPALEPAEVLDRLRQLAKAPFALAQGQLLRMHLVTKPPGDGRSAEQLVLCTMHHITVDGRSLLPVIATLLDAYLAIVAGERPVLVPAAASYADFVDGIFEEGEFELTLEVVRHLDRFVLSLKYNPERYELVIIE
jgi:polyketide synthase PksN